MKILHILDHSLPLHSGYTFRSQNIFREQRKRGWDPVIVTSPKHEESWKKPTIPVEEINGYRYYRTGRLSGSRMPAFNELKLMQAVYRRIKDVAAIEKPDILHAHSPILNAIPALWAGRKLNIPVTYEIRAFWEDAAVDHRTYREGSKKYKAVRSIETWVCRRADHVTVLCNGLKQDLIKRGISAEKMTIIYNGINPDDFKLVPPDEEYIKQWGLSGKRVIGFIGSFYRYEGLDLLVKAFQPIALHHPDTVLLLVGGGEMESELKGLITDLDETAQSNEPNKLNKRILLPGRIPHEKIPGVYALIDILVYPRYPMRLTNLVTPLKPLEAMAMGKPLVASDVGGHRELIHHNENGILFSAGDVSSLRVTLESLLTKGSLVKGLSDKGPTWVQEHHTWEKTTRPYEEVYRGILRNKKKNNPENPDNPV